MTDKLLVAVAYRLVGMPDIAHRLKVKRGTVAQWRYRYRTFPKPVHTLINGPLFDWVAVATWYQNFKFLRESTNRPGRLPGSRRGGPPV